MNKTYDPVYDPETDTIRVLLSSGPIEDTVEIEPDVLADLDTNRNIVGLEVLQASKRFGDPRNADVRPLLREPT